MPQNAWVNAILKLGVLPVIALFLIWRGATVFEDRLKAVEMALQNQQGLLIRTQDQLGTHSMLTEQWINISRQICINTAKNSQQARDCVK